MRIRVLIGPQDDYFEPKLLVEAHLGASFRAMPLAEQHRMIDGALEAARTLALKLVEQGAGESVAA